MAALARASRPGPPRLEVLAPRVGGPPGRVALVPGSFDPMTVGHAALVAGVADADLILLVYSPRTLPKAGAGPPPLLLPAERVESLLAFCETHAGCAVALASHGLYADQAEAAREAFPRADLVLGMGSDKVLQLFDPSWYEERNAALDRLFSLARVAYAVRAADQEPVERVLAANPRWSDRLHRLDLPPEVAGVSSRGVREALARGEAVSALVPRGVLPFVRAAASR